MQQKNLRKELLKENKPKHQANDFLSLSWILSNKPKFKINHNLQKEYLKYVLELKPWKLFKNKFYADKQVLKNIHGKNHATRVTINIFLLLRELNLTKNIVLNDATYV